MIETRKLESRHGDVVLEGFVSAEAGASPRPGVLIFPNFLGLDGSDEKVGERLAALGYVGFGCDLYGKGRRGTDRESGFALMTPFREDRAFLQERMAALLETARAQPEIDRDRIAAIGFCFGGLCVLDLARSGAVLRGVASFHGLLTPPDNIACPRITARVAVYHGWADASVPPEQVVALGEELSKAGCDWQAHAYGGAVHGFTHLGDPDTDIPHNRLAAERSWKSLEIFLAECFA
ncbi:MAG: dienelactone hydrolase family protein [Alphaproteobacteria bacterium]|nr:dienelactone hydrolase family protein [Alphaproteobacteria bacterium]